MVDFDIQEVMRYLPHRYPLLLIDRVLELVPGEHIIAMKNITINEPYFPGHFPGQPVMPAVMILEAMAQATAILCMHTLDQLPADGAIYYFAGIDGARFRKPVRPGDQLHLRVEILKHSRGIWKVNAVGSVDGKNVANAEILGALREM